MEERAFTWFPKLMRQLDAMPDDMAGEFALAVLRYGTYGTEPDLDGWALKAIFEGMRDDIDNSVSSRRTGRKGGRPKRAGAEEAAPAEEKHDVAENEKRGFQECETGVSEVLETPEKHENPNHTKPSHTIPSQAKGSKGARFAPPTPAEVAEYAKSRGTPIDAERFCDFYASKGWKVGSQPMKDWRAAARNWAGRDRKEAGHEEFGELASAF